MANPVVQVIEEMMGEVRQAPTELSQLKGSKNRRTRAITGFSSLFL
ncbi:MAG: hypothetical protein ACREBD_07130 [Blastocatellia bacterium]